MSEPEYDGIDLENSLILEQQKEAEAEDIASPEEKLLDLLDLQRNDEECDVPAVFITGSAGCGKTHLVRELIQKRPSFAVLAATTGIAAVNLSTTTINSLLRYYDTASLADNYAYGYLNSQLHKIADEFENIVIDEFSMGDGAALDILMKSIGEVNQYETMQSRGRKLGLILVGDFCQLPPVKAKWAFESKRWKDFDRHTIRLTKMWRQSDPRFLEALNFLRSGDGSAAVEILREITNWKSAIDRDFDGTTIVAKNDEVDRHNWLALEDLDGEIIRFPVKTWGTLTGPLRDRGEWKNIPEALDLKIGAYVMILANKTFAGGMIYANGDCGHVTEIDVPNKAVKVKLVRTGSVVSVERITRNVAQKEEPDEDLWDPEMGMWDGKKPYYSEEKKRYITGGITYVPLRLAYASTVHKSQGLSLDRVQVDSRAHFFGKPGMAYVAISRARTPEGLYIVGTPRLFATRVSIDEKVRKWL